MGRAFKLLSLGTAIFLILFPLRAWSGDIDTTEATDLQTEPESSDVVNPKAKKPEPENPFYTYNPRAAFHFDLGLLLGMMNVNRSGTLTGTTLAAPVNSSVGGNNPEAGAQFKILVGRDTGAQPFFFVNILSQLDNASTVISRTVAAFGLKTTVILQTDWITRAGFGMQSRPYTTHKIRYGAAVGAAIIPQRLIASIGEENITLNQQKATNIVPSLMASIGIDLCESCFIGLPMSLTAQVVADRNSALSMQTITPLGNTYNVGVNQQWQFHEYAVFAIHY